MLCLYPSMMKGYKMIVDKLVELFRLLEERYPTNQRKHSIGYNKETGELNLTVCHNELWNTLIPELDDLDDPEKVMAEIEKWLT